MFKSVMIGLSIASVIGCMPSLATARTAIVQVPCRDMGDGRTLIDESFVPKWANGSYDTVLSVHPLSYGQKIDVQDWQNRNCTVRVSN
jgi:hypothetical protein